MQNVSDSGSTSEPALRYFFSAKDDILVITLSGVLSRSGSDILKECLARIPTPVKFVVFNLAEVVEADRSGASEFTRLQKELRDRSALLKVCAMTPRLKEELDTCGALRSAEVSVTLIDALKACRSAMVA